MRKEGESQSARSRGRFERELGGLGHVERWRQVWIAWEIHTSGGTHGKQAETTYNCTNRGSKKVYRD